MDDDLDFRLGRLPRRDQGRCSDRLSDQSAQPHRPAAAPRPHPPRLQGGEEPARRPRRSVHPFLAAPTAAWIPLKEFKNLIVLRTFSKVFGLAGLRVGFGIAAPEHHRADDASQADLEHGPAAGRGCGRRARRRRISSRRPSTRSRECAATSWTRSAALNRFSVVGQPRSNFFLLRIEDPALDSTKVFDELLKRGVIVKDGSVSFIDLGKRYLRIDVSFRKQMDRLAGRSPTSVLSR